MKIAVAMSGGVDSSMAAIMLKEAGHDVTGITAELSAALMARHFAYSTGQANAESARRIADSFGFAHHTVNLEEDFYAFVVSPFCREYLRGKTPNPCIRCNPMIKFGSLFQYAKTLNCEKIATGHYAKIKKTLHNRYYIARSVETAKDQSYFLFMLSQESMKDILFPLGDYTKDRVLKMAQERGLAVAKRPESQEICFIPDNRYADFIGRASENAPGPGDIVDTGGAVVGRHRGIHAYTIGQRRGLAIAALRPLYVVGIDAEHNRIIAGHREDLETGSLFATDIHYMKETNLNDLHVLVKTRSTQKPVPARLKEEQGGISVAFKEPQIGISPGQAAVFYNDDMDVLGGGIIERGIRERGDSKMHKSGARKGTINVTWLGTSGVLVSDGETGLLIDPYVSRFGMTRILFNQVLEPDRSLINAWLKKLGGGIVRAVIVSHSHFDHSVDAPCFAMLAGAPLIGSGSTMNIGRGAGMPERQLMPVKPGRLLGFGRFTVTFLESRHGRVMFGKVPYPGEITTPLLQPARAGDYRAGTVFGILITHPSGTILHHGSAGYIPRMYDGTKADVLLLGIAGRRDTEQYIEEVALKTGPHTLIPVHFDNFFRPLDSGLSFLPMVDFRAFVRIAEKYKQSFTLKTLPIGEAVRILP
jgi:tRNA-specific 2-thiouridylase